MRTHDTGRRFASKRMTGYVIAAALTLIASGCATGPGAPQDDATATGLRFDRALQVFCNPVGRACLSLLDARGVESGADPRRAAA